jgi:DNA-binding response OmpR family regulator
MSLLLVEDDAMIAQVLRGLLEAQGHRVTHAAHGLSALSELESESFDAALLDLDLPGVNGLDLARLIRARGMTLPLLAVTARADADAQPDALAAGMDGFLRKPVTGEMLAEGLGALTAAATND